mmetsp:Transcript_51540/g.96534  ORF Transcript_51540/g.96534 Transcript_51540/m.96534 type:complete len:200 (+) Transcript_51540:187-786(+)
MHGDAYFHQHRPSQEQPPAVLELRTARLKNAVEDSLIRQGWDMLDYTVVAVSPQPLQFQSRWKLPNCVPVEDDGIYHCVVLVRRNKHPGIDMRITNAGRIGLCGPRVAEAWQPVETAVQRDLAESLPQFHHFCHFDKLLLGQRIEIQLKAECTPQRHNKAGLHDVRSTRLVARTSRNMCTHASCRGPHGSAHVNSGPRE